MARVKMVRTGAGPDGLWFAGKEYDVPAGISLTRATDFVLRGAASWVDGVAPVVEVADDETVEEAETMEAAPRRRGRPPKR